MSYVAIATLSALLALRIDRYLREKKERRQQNLTERLQGVRAGQRESFGERLERVHKKKRKVDRESMIIW